MRYVRLGNSGLKVSGVSMSPDLYFLSGMLIAQFWDVCRMEQMCGRNGF